MSASDISNTKNKNFGFLAPNFNKRKFSHSYAIPQNKILKQIYNAGKQQCLNNDKWPAIGIINAWMISAETATFMKCGGLGMIGSELPENFNSVFGKDKHEITIVTPLYIGFTGKKKATFDKGLYVGAEGNSLNLEKILSYDVMFAGRQNKLLKHKVTVYGGKLNGVRYLFLDNPRFFAINPAPENPSAQDGCYIFNANHIDEVERFAFLSKAVYKLLELVLSDKPKQIAAPNILVANDWHSGALSGLTKYFTAAKVYAGRMSAEEAETIQNIPIIHIAHHLGYQGWDYNNTSRILNSLYEDLASVVFKNAKAVKNSNPRTANTLIIADTYNQASCNIHLADRIIAVSKNYMEEVSKEKSFGYDFRDVLKIRKNYRNFFGIVNGYEKKLISPNAKKIDTVNSFFGTTKFKIYDENSLDVKLHNKKECIKLLSKLANDEKYRENTIPLIETYQFENISSLVDKADHVPFICMTSRLVEQKGYDVAINAILKMIFKYKNSPQEFPIFVLGGAGNKDLYADLMALKDNAKQICREFAKRIFVFRGYKDQFAYAVQLAADFYMMPSYFEPCGLTQMEAMAKGSLPIATSTGGLVDTIEDGIDGFRTDVFFAGGERIYGSNLKAQNLKNNLNAYSETLEKALRCYYTTPKAMHIMQKNAMEKDFSWSIPNGSVYKYYKLFKTGSL